MVHIAVNVRSLAVPLVLLAIAGGCAAHKTVTVNTTPPGAKL
jgi:hypothetical protein